MWSIRQTMFCAGCGHLCSPSGYAPAIPSVAVCTPALPRPSCSRAHAACYQELRGLRTPKKAATAGQQTNAASKQDEARTGLEPPTRRIALPCSTYRRPSAYTTGVSHHPHKPEGSLRQVEHLLFELQWSMEVNPRNANERADID